MSRDSEHLQTPRLSLRRPTVADVDAIFRIHADPQACAHNPGDAITTRAGADERYRSWDEHWNRHGFGYWTIHSRTARDAPRPLGFCGIKLMRLHDHTVLNLFYRLDPGAWGSGIATEAATAVVNWATANASGYPLIARVRPGNAASLSVAARAGLHRAQHLDTAGEDGLDWIFAIGWPAGKASA